MLMVLLNDTLLQLADLRVLRGRELVEELDLHDERITRSRQTRRVSSSRAVMRSSRTSGVELLVEPSDHGLNSPLALGSAQAAQVGVERGRQLAGGLVIWVISRR